MTTRAQHSSARTDKLAAESPEETELRAQLRILAAQSENANPIVAVAAATLIFTMYDRVKPAGLMAWAGMAIAIAVWRHWISKRIREESSTADERTLRRFERLMLGGSAASSLIMGSAFWLIASQGDTYAKMIVTLISVMHMVAVLLYLTPRFTDRIIRTAGNVLQGVLFWIFVGDEQPPNWEVVVVYGGLFWCGMVFSREQLRQFRESLQIRNQNAELLRQLEADRQVIQGALEEARLANASKSRFLAAASHDLRQPLHALTMFLGTLGFHVVTDEAKRLLGRIRDTVGVLEEQFNSLLDISRFDVGAVKPELQDVRLDGLVDKLVEEFRPQAEAKGIHLSATIIPVLGHTDPVLLGRLLRNLIDNAVHYTSKGSVQIRIQPAGDRLAVAVVDTGSGIPDEQQARIFDEYVQLDNPGRLRKHGVGLGLAIVRRIDQLLGLQLQLKSTPGEGSKFQVQVPVSSSAPPLLLSTGPVIDQLGFRTSARVWILDDEPIVLEGLQSQLEAWGAKVNTFQSAEELVAALEKASEPPDWILTDDMLGMGVSGLEVAQQVARDHPGTRVGIVTGNTELGRLDLLQASGFPVVVKPAKPEQLVRLLADPATA